MAVVLVVVVAAALLLVVVMVVVGVGVVADWAQEPLWLVSEDAAWPEHLWVLYFTLLPGLKDQVA
jgi:hypothetical protein